MLRAPTSPSNQEEQDWILVDEIVVDEVLVDKI
jgi:hypothetical protein